MSIYRQGPAPANTCPRCRENLLGVPGHPGVRHCERCGGVFADVEATRRIVSRLDRALLEIGFQAGLGKVRRPEDARNITCPECLIEMQKTRIEAAACDVDACPMHGTWFDTGELEDVMRAFARGRKKGALPPGTAPLAHDPPLVSLARATDSHDDLFRPRSILAEFLTSLFKG